VSAVDREAEDAIVSRSRRKPETSYVFMIRVTGGGTFPFDMLRHDNCVPLSEQDSNAMLS